MSSILTRVAVAVLQSRRVRGSFSLYSMAKVVLGVVAGDIADTAEAMLAELCVVHLEGVVVAVLPGS